MNDMDITEKDINKLIDWLDKEGENVSKKKLNKYIEDKIVNKCKKCEYLGDLAPCDECYYKIGK